MLSNNAYEYRKIGIKLSDMKIIKIEITFVYQNITRYEALFTLLQVRNSNRNSIKISFYSNTVNPENATAWQMLNLCYTAWNQLKFSESNAR
jgi:hypothetical protein